MHITHCWARYEMNIQKGSYFIFFHDFFLGPSMFFDFFLMVLQLFTTFVNFCHLFSNVLNFSDIRRTGEGFPSAVGQRGRMRKQCCPQMMLFSSCLQVIFYHFIRHIHLDSWKGWSQSEMEKRVDAADASMLFFSLAVLFFWLYTRKLAKKKSCAICTVLSTISIVP